MLRTRDLVLFVVIAFFLIIAIATTVVRDTSIPERYSVAFNDADSTVGLETTAPESLLDRKSVINRLREKLQNSTERIAPAASVEAPEEEEGAKQQKRGVQRCLYPDDALSMVPQWPQTDVGITVQEGARLVSFSETVVIPSSANTASSTVSEEVVTTVTPLLQLPLTPLKQVDASCVPSEVVGVTSGGGLMFNGDVNAYRKTPENALIGYARDGFPVYGVYEGEVDQCGGYEHPSGYRYTISTERDYIVGCYTGVPSSFSL
jgi:hypothetical protein